MGWGTLINPEICIKKHYSDVNELLDDINDIKESLNYYKNKIYMYASSNPKDIIIVDQDENTNLIDQLNINMNEIMEEYNDLSIELFKLELLLDNFDSKVEY
jgi:hypothetical protein